MKNIEERDIKKFEERSEGKLIVVDDVNSPFAMTKLGLAHGQSLADIEKMLELQIKWEENEAKKAYFGAVAGFKENPPEVLKDKKNSQFNDSGYTSIGNLLKTVNPVLGKHGLSASYEITQAGELITVACKLSHRLGHSESVSMSAPPDKSGGNSKNPIQQIKSTITYLKGVTFESVTGLAATDANRDDDGNAAGTPVEYITLDQQTEINDAIADLYADGGKKFLEFLEVESVETIPLKKYKAALAALKTVRTARKPIRQHGDDG